MQETSPLFFTINNPRGEQNPNAVRIIKELKRRNHRAVVLKSPAEYMLVAGQQAVALFDYNAEPCHVHHFRHVSVERPIAPPWSRLGTKFAFAISGRCVAEELYVASAVGQIARSARSMLARASLSS